MVGVFYIVVLPPPFQVFFRCFFVYCYYVECYFLGACWDFFYTLRLLCVCKIDEEEPKKNYCIVEKGKGGMSRSN